MEPTGTHAAGRRFNYCWRNARPGLREAIDCAQSNQGGGSDSTERPRTRDRRASKTERTAELITAQTGPDRLSDRSGDSGPGTPNITGIVRRRAIASAARRDVIPGICRPDNLRNTPPSHPSPHLAHPRHLCRSVTPRRRRRDRRDVVKYLLVTLSVSRPSSRFFLKCRIS